VSAAERKEFSVSLRCGRSLGLGRRTAVMGVLNVTPDSFHDGGRLGSVDAAVRRGADMLAEGADLIDVGGESSRPGARSVDVEEECLRVMPVIERLRESTDAVISVDTVKAEVARRAVDAGADIVNDISALADPAMADVVVESGAAVVLMHMRGTPRTMQADTRYDDVTDAVRTFLRKAAENAASAGVPDDKILLDPGIGFGKSAAGSMELIRRLPDLAAIGKPVLVGASRKSFIGAVLDLPADERLEGSLAVAALAAWLGAHVIRVHDVRETVRVVRMIDAVRGP
jgi:dihydropteroate synthase